MQVQGRPPEETYGPALIKAVEALAALEPGPTAGRAAVDYGAQEGGGGRFTVQFLGQLHEVEWPAGRVVRAAEQDEVDVATRLLLLHYLVEADGTPLANRWLAFRNLPGGMGYEAAFRARASGRLARAYGADAAGFERAARSLGAEGLSFGDRSFLFRALPRVWIAVVMNLADEEFPAEANVLFDAAAGHYLPTEDLAVLGGMLAGRLIEAGREL